MCAADGVCHHKIEKVFYRCAIRQTQTETENYYTQKRNYKLPKKTKIQTKKQRK